MTPRRRSLRALAWGLGLALAGSPTIFAECEAPLLTTPPDRDLARCVHDAGYAGDWAETERELARRIRAYPDRPWPRHWYAQVYRRNHPTSHRIPGLYEDALARFRTHDIPVGELMARDGLRVWLNGRHLPERAQEQVRLAVERHGRSTDPLVRARVLRLEAHQMYEDRDNLRGALDKLETALEILDRSEEHVDFRLLLLNSAAVFALELASFDKAQEYQETAIELARAEGRDRQQALIYSNLPYTFAHRYLQNPSPAVRREAVESARRGLELARRHSDWRTEARLEQELATLLGALEGPAHLERCVEVANRHGELQVESECLIHLALMWAPEDPGRAAEFERRALETARGSGDPLRAEAYVRAFAAYADWYRLPRAEAFESFETSLGPIEELRLQQEIGAGRAEWFSTWADHHQIFVGRLLQHHLESGAPAALETAFRVSEAMRSRALHDALQAVAARPSREQDERRARLHGRLERFNQRLMSASTETLPRLERQRDAAERELRTLERPVAPPLSETPAEAPLELSAARTLLAADEALLIFQAAPEEDIYHRFKGGSWVMVVTRDDARVAPLPRLTDSARALPILRDQLRRRDGRETRSLVALHDLLLTSALAMLPDAVRRLVVVADGALHNVPLAALRPAPDAPPLAARFALSRVPSVTLWAHWRRGREAAGDRRPALALTAPETASRTLDGTELGPLPLAREEGRRLSRLLGSGVDLREGAEASEALIESLPLDGYRILHFAAHARADHERPERSALYLAPGAPGQDGLLQFREITDLDMEGCVVVLSACDTASGQVLRGEGVLDLARAFFQARSHAVVASLWPLRDDEAMELVDVFYRHLARGESLSGALAAAQRDRIAAGAPTIAWAGWVVLGDGARTPFPDGRGGPPPWLWVAVAALLLLALALVAHAVRTRRRPLPPRAEVVEFRAAARPPAR